MRCLKRWGGGRKVGLNAAVEEWKMVLWWNGEYPMFRSIHQLHHLMEMKWFNFLSNFKSCSYNVTKKLGLLIPSIANVVSFWGAIPWRCILCIWDTMDSIMFNNLKQKIFFNLFEWMQYIINLSIVLVYIFIFLITPVWFVLLFLYYTIIGLYYVM